MNQTSTSLNTSLNIVKATILLTKGTDLIHLDALVIEPIWPHGNITQLRMEASPDKGEDWVKENLPGTEIKVINLRE
jgi:hypothetical protein